MITSGVKGENDGPFTSNCINRNKWTNFQININRHGIKFKRDIKHVGVSLLYINLLFRLIKSKKLNST